MGCARSRSPTSSALQGCGFEGPNEDAHCEQNFAVCFRSNTPADILVLSPRRSSIQAMGSCGWRPSALYTARTGS